MWCLITGVIVFLVLALAAAVLMVQVGVDINNRLTCLVQMLLLYVLYITKHELDEIDHDDSKELKNAFTHLFMFLNMAELMFFLRRAMIPSPYVVQQFSLLVRDPQINRGELLKFLQWYLLNFDQPLRLSRRQFLVAVQEEIRQCAQTG